MSDKGIDRVQKWSRRGVLAALAGGSAAALAEPLTRANSLQMPIPDGTVFQRAELVAQERRLAIAGLGGAKLPFLVYNDGLLPFISMTKGERLQVKLVNKLSEHTSIHWHGVRVANGMDGIPWLTQAPVQPGESYVYDFVPPDAGTFFFHPHCNETGQIGRGLTGILLVDDAVDPYHGRNLLAIRDWRIDPAKRDFLPMTTDKGAATSGTFGTVRTVNGAVQPNIPVDPHPDFNRLSLLNVDPTRVIEVGVEGGTAFILAVDGFAIEPIPLESWRMGPAMRLDIAFRIDKGKRGRLVDYFGGTPTTLATFSEGKVPIVLMPRGPAPLQPHGLAEPDLATAQTLAFALTSASAPTEVAEPIVLPDGRLFDPSDQLCLTSRTFWAINQKTWPGHGAKGLPQPLFTLERGRNYVLEVTNATPHMHPFHLHGYAFKVLDCSILPRPVHRADTVLVMPKERVRLAFVADNPGDWMVHCHILEHQETGMMGTIRVL